MPVSELVYSIIVYAFIFLFGITIGSFLNVCIYRLPKEESLTKQNSHCMTCGAQIKRYDLIPVFSWLFLRGKCRSCGAKISPRYCIVEALNGIIYVLVFMYYDFMYSPIKAILVCLLMSALIVVFFMDWDTQLISNYMVLFIAILGILDYLRWQFELDLYHIDDADLKSRIIGFFVVSLILLAIELLSKGKAMGRGDVYLMAAAGLFLGVKATVAAFFIGLVTASIAGLIIKHCTGGSKFAFGPWLSLGIAICAIWGNQLADLYLRFAGFIQ
ncbi:MAG: prepilin peptidase [Oscillospiraceae bacterium]|nr:prepilin peptidase [Oscillospiraceae bacterium]